MSLKMWFVGDAWTVSWFYDPQVENGFTFIYIYASDSKICSVSPLGPQSIKYF
jgi:hypothetical protein